MTLTGFQPQPGTLRTLATAALCLVLLSGCLGVQAGQATARVAGPRGTQMVEDIGEIAALPTQVGPFQRRHTIIYRPGERDFSIAYDIRSPRLQAASTVYFYGLEIFPAGPLRSLNGQFADATGALEQGHATAELVERSPVNIVQGGLVYEGLRAAYRLEEPFDGKHRALASEVAVFLVGDEFVKFRHTYFWEDREERASQITELMQRIDWSDPAFVIRQLQSL